ncbi:bifunctional MaoC family dehydratase N-terminal/OB-fold nucleic acid binding domain-containing protein [Streptomyces sp. CSDS2]|uniref:bifunctional MaoC family dehydratase N-terminal/OB-fold nucleic acid binding domain-containing protein n=1 Tax=Streptomyces sp. CSDS2 TaxID=3055051 RepID=UPI0025AEEEAF|nr:bifunctional MaoC family dehydratase N-terminal/OB-fold nucleic acid binding domain-containing protein [Streptomyces sp. CSDS2]MDN3259488.1 bifunctional MaoC family dehydratase N-terminal/OB-fold nucleic acid binding domain-containing protein [Streptomyces sp. CSDS2]
MGERPGEDGLDERLKEFVGRPAAVAGVGKDPVNAPMIRHWCEALGDTHPAYTGPDAIAPPTMLQVWTMGGLSGHPGRTGAYEELLGLLDAAGCTAVVATDCEQEYPRPLRPGDEVTFDTVIEAVSGRKTTRLGTGYFITTRTEVRVAGEPAGVHRFRILKYAPARDRNREPRHGGEGEVRRLQEPEPRLRREPEPPESPRPRPVINRDNAGFWQGVAEGRLLIQRCTGCGTPRHPWLPGCNACGGLGWDTVEASGEGTVYSYVVVHHPPVPGFDPPYAVVLVELAEGVRMVGDMAGVPYDEVRIGMPVRAGFRRVDEELTLPVFQAVTPVTEVTAVTGVTGVER